MSVEFRISAEIFLRLRHAALQPSETHSKYDAGLRSVRIEQIGGVAVAVASCGHVIVAECLTDCGEDGFMNLTIDPAMIKLAEDEAEKDGVIIVTQAPGWTVAKGSETGRMYPLNAEISAPWPEWRDIVPDHLPTKHNGVFALHADYLARIAKTSPSAIITLPKFADVDGPVLFRDPVDPDWLALILMNNEAKKASAKHAEYPEWIRV